MCWIKEFLRKVRDFLSPVSEEKEEFLLCVFLKQDTDFVFRSPDKTLGDPKSLSPIIIPIPEMSPVEISMQEIQDLLFKEFAIEPEKITISYQYQSLAPFEKKTLFFATVEITSQDIQELLSFTEESFVLANTPYIALNEESNLFFKYLLAVLENS